MGIHFIYLSISIYFLSHGLFNSRYTKYNELTLAYFRVSCSANQETGFTGGHESESLA